MALFMKRVGVFRNESYALSFNGLFIKRGRKGGIGRGRERGGGQGGMEREMS